MPAPEGFVGNVRDNPVTAILVLYRDGLMDAASAEGAIRSAIEKEKGRTQANDPRRLEELLRSSRPSDIPQGVHIGSGMGPHKHCPAPAP